MPNCALLWPRRAVEKPMENTMLRPLSIASSCPRSYSGLPNASLDVRRFRMSKSVSRLATYSNLPRKRAPKAICRVFKRRSRHCRLTGSTSIANLSFSTSIFLTTGGVKHPEMPLDHWVSLLSALTISFILWVVWVMSSSQTASHSWTSLVSIVLVYPHPRKKRMKWLKTACFLQLMTYLAVCLETITQLEALDRIKALTLADSKFSNSQLTCPRPRANRP